MPKVTTIIPNYNHSHFLKERIESVLAQTYQDFDVIILDDLSQDNSKEIIETYRKHPKITSIIYNTENSGSTFKQWNKGVSIATGEWIWIAESDDSADPSLLEKLLIPASTDSDIVLSYCQSTRLSSSGEITGSWITHTAQHSRNYSEDFVEDGIEYIKKDLISRNTIPNASGAIFRRDAFLKAGTADEDIKYNSDWLLWMKILFFGKIAFVSEAYNNFRYHDNSVITKAVQKAKIPFKKKYDIAMMLRFNDYVNNLGIGEIISLTNIYIYELYWMEFQFLYKEQKLKKESLRYLIHAIKYSRNKIKTILKALNFIKFYY